MRTARAVERREGVASWRLLLLLWALGEKPLGVRPRAVCSPTEDSACSLLTVSDLFDRVIQHSSRIHRLSVALCIDVEKYILPGGNELAQSVGKCHTSWLWTPNCKEYAQKMPAWKELLSHFDQNIAHHRTLPDESVNKAKEITNMVHELKTGVEKVVEKMQSMGIISNSLNGVGSSEPAGLSINNGANLMNDYEFIHCFRRDSSKVQNYLKVLKCRSMPENSC